MSLTDGLQTMPAGDKSIGKRGKKFTKNDPRINRKGQPVKKFSEHIKELKDKGYQAPTRNEYFEMVGLLVAMSETHLNEFEADKDKPYWIRLIVKDLNTSANRGRMMSDYRDWLYGRAAQQVDMTSGGEKITQNQPISETVLEKLIDKL